MLFFGADAAMPYNMSAWRSGSLTDQYNLSTGFYNITLPGTAEATNYLLYATATDGTKYYGGYRNISLNFTDTDTEVNFTAWPLMSTDWGTLNSNITMNDATDWARINISTARQTFNLVNGTGLLNEISAHIEVTVDYTNYNATEFTFMMGIAQGASSSFYVPLINATGIKEINVYSMNYAPKRVGTRTAAQILANNNITLNNFDPEDIDKALAASNIIMELYISNSTCDVPNPTTGCRIGSSENMGDHDPFGAIIGGGKLSFRMGTGGILIHYVNVNLLASGPPDALFDGSTSETTTGDFNSALRFGSLGPTIYDFVLVSIPYTEGSSSTTGLDESAEVNISIPLFYDENLTGVMDWDNPIWNTTANGTSGGNLAGNHTHFSTFSSDWQTLMGNNTCVTNVSTFNVTNPCYIDKTNNRIWIRLPHFSGTKPNIVGSVITALPVATPDDTPGGGGLTTTDEWTDQKINSFTTITPGKPVIISDFEEDMGIKQIQIEVTNEAQDVRVTVTKYDSKPAAVSVAKPGKVYRYLQIETENLADNLDKATITIQVEKSWVSENSLEMDEVALFKFDESAEQWNELTTTFSEEDDTYYYYDIELTSFSYFAVGEKVVIEPGEGKEGELAEKIKDNKWMIIVVVVLIILVILYLLYKKKR